MEVLLVGEGNPPLWVCLKIPSGRGVKGMEVQHGLWKRSLAFSTWIQGPSSVELWVSFGCGSKPCSTGEHQNRWYVGVHPAQNGGIGYDPWPFGGNGRPRRQPGMLGLGVRKVLLRHGSRRWT